MKPKSKLKKRAIVFRKGIGLMPPRSHGDNKKIERKTICRKKVVDNDTN